MNTHYKNFWKLLLLIFAVIIGIGSLVFTTNLVSKLKIEERRKVELWAEATQLLSLSDTTQSIDFLFSIIGNNNTVPVILTDEFDNIISSKNFNSEKIIKNPQYLENSLQKIKEYREPIVIELSGSHYNLIYYKDSVILTMLMYYPYIQLGIILMFLLVSYLAFNSSQVADRNRVWVGMSKETAHQLGTPTSSLAGWIEVLQQKHPEVKITEELSRDVERLEKITERFSRIGSKAVLSPIDLIQLILKTIDYLKTRTSSKVLFKTDFDSSKTLIVLLNAALFEWVIENVAKNAIDAMEGNGTITFQIKELGKNVIIDVYDTGKGIPKSSFRKIFFAGFSTKQRGWGVGLSLAKRIVEDYHHGKIFVKYSEIGKGSCIRIVLSKEII